ncbi:MAG TPA: hypothetical protein VLK22_00090 [Candidatus Udaeobacter sp.]|nr:hypothetical protein [Candidatus Udaeobacter sp.]
MYIILGLFLMLSASTAEASRLSVGDTSGCYVYKQTTRLGSLAGKMLCWGSNDKGQLGTGGFSPSSVPVAAGLATIPATPTLVWTWVSVGAEHACGLKDPSGIGNQDLYCWGRNLEGQLGIGNFTNQATPTRVMSNVVWVTAAGNYTCAEIVTSTVNPITYQLRCWGENTNGQLGIGTFSGLKNLPTPVVNPNGVGNLTTTVQGGFYSWTAGPQHACVVMDLATGVTYCWGDNDHGQLGIGGFVSQPRPTRVLQNFISISAGGSHTCGLGFSDDLLRCWGYNFYGQVGNGNRVDQTSPALVLGLPSGTSLARVGDKLGQNHSCVSKQDPVSPKFPPHLWCWGYNNNRQLGDLTMIDKTSATLASGMPPLPATQNRGYVAVSGGGHTQCSELSDALTSTSPVNWETSVWCEGNGSSGQVGNGTFLPQNNPAKIISVIFQ